jgi:hypothetical protein
MPTTRRFIFRSLRLRLAALLTITIATVLAACSDPLGPDSEPFYYYEDQKIYLRVDTRKLTAVPEAEGDTATFRTVLGRSGVAVDSIRAIHIPGHWFVHLPSSTSARRAESAARALRADAGVRFASAAYRERGADCGIHMVNRLTVQFRPEADAAAIEQLNRGMGVRNEQLNPWGTRAYEFPKGLIATPLELAARYHRNPLVDWAAADHVNGCLWLDGSTGAP